MTFKISTWDPEKPLPRYADRATIAAIISHFHFPVSARTIETWPLQARRPNRAVILSVEEAMAYAQEKLDRSITYQQGGDWL